MQDKKQTENILLNFLFLLRVIAVSLKDSTNRRIRYIWSRLLLVFSWDLLATRKTKNNSSLILLNIILTSTHPRLFMLRSPGFDLNRVTLLNDSSFTRKHKCDLASCVYSYRMYCWICWCETFSEPWTQTSPSRTSDGKTLLLILPLSLCFFSSIFHPLLVRLEANCHVG